MNSKERALRPEETISFSVLGDYVALTKPRLLFIVLMSTLIGYVLPESSTIKISLLHLIIGTALTGGGAHVLNQWLERVQDAQMKRTRERPLPSGRMKAEEAFVYGLFLSLIGVTYLWLTVNMLTASMGALTLASYLLVYTPLKRKTPLNTWLGAITGALPPLMGWTAQQGTFELACLPIFALLYFWQLPHFFAIAWMYREDYRRAGFRMLSLSDVDGTKTGLQMLLNGVFMLIASVSFYFINQGGVFFLGIALVGGFGFLVSILRFMKKRTEEKARSVFLLSIVYLPVLCSVMVVDHIFLR